MSSTYKYKISQWKKNFYFLLCRDYTLGLLKLCAHFLPMLLFRLWVNKSKFVEEIKLCMQVVRNGAYYLWCSAQEYKRILTLQQRKDSYLPLTEFWCFHLTKCEYSILTVLREPQRKQNDQLPKMHVRKTYSLTPRHLRHYGFVNPNKNLAYSLAKKKDLDTQTAPPQKKSHKEAMLPLIMGWYG